MINNLVLDNILTKVMTCLCKALVVHKLEDSGLARAIDKRPHGCYHYIYNVRSLLKKCMLAQATL